jgi:glycosyltransferase involved in cell wall biosynthesis
MPRVSVVIALHNSEAYLREAIESVLSQDLDDLELLLLDAGSTDASEAIATATGDSRVRYERRAEWGPLFRKFNVAVARATAPLIRLMGHDDVMPGGSLRAFVEFAEARPDVGLVYSDFHSNGRNGEPLGVEHRYDAQRERTPPIASPNVSALLFFVYGCLPGNIATVLLRKEACEEVGGFREDSNYSMDFEMWVRLSERWKVGFIRKPLMRVRLHPGQLSHAGRRSMRTIEELNFVFERLRPRVSRSLTGAEQRRLRSAYWGRQHVHWVANALWRGQLGAAWRGLRSIAAGPTPTADVISWLTTMNGRFGLPDRDAMFDVALARLAVSEPRSPTTSTEEKDRQTDMKD